MIDGYTRVIAHVGNPTRTFMAPLIYNPYFESIGLNAIVVPMGVTAEDGPKALPLIFRMTNVMGALITMPHKVAVVKLLDDVSTTVKVCGACNAVRRDAEGRLVGDMFDGEGFVRGVLRKGQRVAGARALVIGAGGVGSAIAAALAKAGLAQIGLFDVDSPAMARLARRLGAHFPDLAISLGSIDPIGFDIVVNATPLGMNVGDPLPLDVTRIDPSAFVGEVVLKKEMTPLLAAAQAKGCRVQVGLDMLFEQIPAYLEFFGLPSTTPDELRRLARTAH